MLKLLKKSNFDMGELMNVKECKIGIIGGGSIGVTLAVALTSLGYDVEMVVRTVRGVKIDNSYSYTIKGDFGDKNYLIKTFKKVENFSEGLDFIFVTTKSYDSIELIKRCQNKLTENGTVVTIQNVYSLNRIEKIIPSNKVICAVLDFNTTNVNNVFYVKNFNGITLGIYDTEAYQPMILLSNILKNVCKVFITKDIVGFIMGRNIINLAVSSLGAISGLNLGQILDTKYGKRIFVEIIKESVSVVRQYNINILPYNNQLDYYKFCDDKFVSKIYRQKILTALRKNNGDIKSSALQDLEKGRKTELSFVVEILQEYSKKSNIAIPNIDKIYTMILEIENGERQINKNVFKNKSLINL